PPPPPPPFSFRHNGTGNPSIIVAYFLFISSTPPQLTHQSDKSAVYVSASYQIDRFYYSNDVDSAIEMDLRTFSIMTAAARWDSEVCSCGEARKKCVEQKGLPALG
ncbi:hypothetical protein A2U01_0052560, partial [Trifolium medium]|nr:hypothetical protein [Trifolium medium]